MFMFSTCSRELNQMVSKLTNEIMVTRSIIVALHVSHRSGISRRFMAFWLQLECRN